MPDKLLTLVINLASSPHRLDSIGADLAAANLPWRRLEGVDYRGQDPHAVTIYDSRASHIRHDGDMTGGEMGCALSHLKALKEFLQSDADYVLVLEDDSSVPPDAAAILDGLLAGLDQFAPDGWDTVFPALTSKGYDRPAFSFAGQHVWRTSFTPCGAAAIVWSRAGAQSYLDSRFGRKIAGPIDREFRSHFARRGRSYKMVPAPFHRYNLGSDIESGGTRFGAGGRPSKSSVRSRVMRHFPDYFHAWRNTIMWRLGLR